MLLEKLLLDFEEDGSSSWLLLEDGSSCDDGNGAKETDDIRLGVLSVSFTTLQMSFRVGILCLSLRTVEILPASSKRVVAALISFCFIVIFSTYE